jgi:hypothetical protein
MISEGASLSYAVKEEGLNITTLKIEGEIDAHMRCPSENETIQIDLSELEVEKL